MVLNWNIQLQLVRTVSAELVNRVMKMSMREVQTFCSIYREQIIKFKLQHFKDRSILQFFTYYMVMPAMFLFTWCYILKTYNHIKLYSNAIQIAIINNCMQFVELAQQLRNRYYRPPDPTVAQTDPGNDADKQSLNVIKAFINLRDEAISFLLDEMFLDLEPHLVVLFTKNW